MAIISNSGLAKLSLAYGLVLFGNYWMNHDTTDDFSAILALGFTIKEQLYESRPIEELLYENYCMRLSCINSLHNKKSAAEEPRF